MSDLELLKVYRDRKWRLWKQGQNYLVDFGDRSKPVVVKVPEGYEEQDIISAIDFMLDLPSRGRRLCLTNASLIRYALEKVMVRSRSLKTMLNCVDVLLAVERRTRKSPDELVEFARKDREAVERLLVKTLKAFIRDRKLSHSSARVWKTYLQKFLEVNGIEIKLNIEFPPPRRDYASMAPTRKQVEEMIDLATNPRDKAIIAMMATSGLRIGTLFRLKYKHLRRDFEAGRIPVAIHVPAEITKGKYMGYTTFINMEAVAYLKLWLKFWEKLVGREIKDDDYIFIKLKDPSPDKPLDPKSWDSNVFVRIREKMGIRRREGRIKRFEISPHGLRKFFKTQLIRNGVPIEAVEYMMGHRTDTYTRIESLGEDWLRQKYNEGIIRIRVTRPRPEEIRRQVREYLLSIGVPEEEVGEYIKSAMTMIQAGLKIEDLIYLKKLSP